MLHTVEASLQNWNDVFESFCETGPMHSGCYWSSHTKKESCAKDSRTSKRQQTWKVQAYKSTNPTQLNQANGTKVLQTIQANPSTPKSFPILRIETLINEKSHSRSLFLSAFLLRQVLNVGTVGICWCFDCVFVWRFFYCFAFNFTSSIIF